MYFIKINFVAYASELYSIFKIKRDVESDEENKEGKSK